MKGGRHSLAKEKEESEDELLLTTKTNHKLQEDIDKSKEQALLFAKFFHLHPNHPQHNTHYATMLNNSDGFVPNFVGGSILRKDGGRS